MKLSQLSLNARLHFTEQEAEYRSYFVECSETEPILRETAQKAW